MARRSAPAKSSRRRWRTLGIGAAAFAAGAALVGIFAHRREWMADDAEGHAAPDLAPDAPRPGSDGERAPEAFRPDPTAIPTASEREALRPAPATDWN